MNKKIFAGVMALSLMISGALCGCNADKDNESDENSPSSSRKSDSASIDNKKDESTAKDASLTDKIYADYLSQQKICKISKNFKILEAGTARDNPNGLAGAVKHDFDSDKIDELVTFTFEKNSTNGEDIRVDLLKVSGDKLMIADSKYLTELTDLSSQPKKNTIYFDWTATAEIITSEYNDNLYFGCLFSEARDDFNRGSDFFGGFGVFTIENDKIIEQSVGYTESAIDCDVIAELLPPSIRDTADTEGLVDAENRIIAYSGMVDGEKKGLYASEDEAISAMLNEFGLDIQFKYDDESSTHSDADPDYHWISKNGSTLKTILCTEYLMSYQSDNSFMNGYDNYYAGIKLVLNSDLETLLGNDSPFKEPFADELALYEDILKYPYYYHEIWDNFVQNNYGTSYFVADIDQNGEKELVITGKLSNIVCNVTVVKHDLTVLSNEIGGGSDLRIYDNGVIAIFDTNPYANVYYLDSTTGESLVGTSNDGKRYIFGEGMQDEKYSGDEADAKEAELLSGARLITDFNYYDLYYPEILGELVFIDDISKITYTWQKAYSQKIDELSGEASQYTEAALIYIDDDDIPELFLQNYAYGNFALIYSCQNGEAYEMGDISGLRMRVGGYKEKGSMYYSDFNSGAGEIEGHDFYQLENGYGVITTSFSHDLVNETYYIDNKEVDEKTYNQRLDKLSQGMTSSPELLSYDEIMEKLNADS